MDDAVRQALMKLRDECGSVVLQDPDRLEAHLRDLAPGKNAEIHSWPRLCRGLEKLRLGRFQGPAGVFRQRTEPTPARRAILAKLQRAEPPRLCKLTAAAAAL